MTIILINEQVGYEYRDIWHYTTLKRPRYSSVRDGAVVQGAMSPDAVTWGGCRGRCDWDMCGWSTFMSLSCHRDGAPTRQIAGDVKMAWIQPSPEELTIQWRQEGGCCIRCGRCCWEGCWGQWGAEENNGIGCSLGQQASHLACICYFQRSVSQGDRTRVPWELNHVFLAAAPLFSSRAALFLGWVQHQLIIISGSTQHCLECWVL